VSERYAIARTADLADGERLLVDVGGRSIGVFRVDGRYYALLNRCPHAGAELCRGRLVGTLESDAPGRYSYDADRRLIACPWHGWEFDIATGQSYVDPRRLRVRPYHVDVEAGRELMGAVAAGEAALAGQLVPGPYRAETFDVSVEDEYLVLTVGSRTTRPD
jgi:nitrite reductase/ring-hydroxylating ferredoxin subunit